MKHTSSSPAREARSLSQPMAVNIRETSPEDNPRRFQLELSECVETKTVTTTTRLTRKFPHVFVSNPMPLESLDAKEYPLALKPTPPELADFTYHIPVTEDTNDTIEEIETLHSTHDDTLDDLSPSGGKSDTSFRDTPTTLRLLRASSRSPSETQRLARMAKSKGMEMTLAPATDRMQRQARNSSLKAVSDKLRRSIAHGSTSAANGSSSTPREPLERPSRPTSGFLATPDASELVDTATARRRSSRPRDMYFEQADESPSRNESQLVETSQYDSASPSGSDSHTIFGSNVATPPITDTDAAPFADPDETLQRAGRALHHRPTIDVVAAQDASLPSPRLSPTLAAAGLHRTDPEADEQGPPDYTEPSIWAEGSLVKQDADAMDFEMRPTDSTALERFRGQSEDKQVVLDPRMLVEAFDSMRTEMKTFMMFQFLRRCPRPTLRVVANAVNPALKCDFLFQLPLELSYHVLSYLDHRDLCRAAQVSKHWRNIVDRNETGWKDLFDRDGYTLPAGEMNKAILQGWGWQDPVGLTGFERDLSMHNRLTSSESELTRSLKIESTPKSRSSKRKRGLNTYSVSERTKRRASGQESMSSRDDKAHNEVKQHRSEGPLSAASAAAAAVPDPHLGLASLRELHLYKSLYRRHHMIRQSWTSGEVKPAHVAFAAHPRHVITCLQFDEDKIITGSDDTFIHVYDTKTGKLRNKLAGHEGGVWALQYEGNTLVSGSTDRSVRVWDIERGLCQQVFYGHTSTVRCLQILMPTETGKDSHGKSIMQPEKPLIITGSRDSQLRVWRLPEAKSKRYFQAGLPVQESDCPYFIRALSGHTHSVRAISAHGDTLVSGSYDSVVRVWRISTGECLHILHGHSQKVYSVVLDHERNRCISGSMDSLVKIWDLNTGACLHTLEGHSLLVGLLDLRDERLVSAAADSTLRIWDPETGRCKNTLMAHTGAITCFQHDGRKVISGSEKTVKMWDVQNGECVQDLLTDLSGVWQVKFDGRRCVAAVQRDQLTYVEILDFGAVRDGQPPENLGRRILLNEDEVQAIIEEEV